MKKLFIALCLFVLASCAGHEAPREFRIFNSAGEAIYVQADGLENAGNKKLAFVQHGLASNLEHPAVQTAKKAFLDNGYVVITFDSRYALGNSDGKVIDGRLATFEDDLETVTQWAGQQEFYSKPFALAGHSLGGGAVLQYAAQHPDAAEAVVAITPVVSGGRWEKSCMDFMPDFCREWKQRGFYDYQGEVIPYAVVDEAKSFDAVAAARDIRAKVLLITAKDDQVIAPHDVKDIYPALKGQKSLGVVSEGGHNFATAESRRELYDFISRFLQSQSH